MANGLEARSFRRKIQTAFTFSVTMLFFSLVLQATFPVHQVSFVDAFFLDDTFYGYHIIHHLCIECTQFTGFNTECLAIIATYQEHLLGTVATSMCTYTLNHYCLVYQFTSLSHYIVNTHGSYSFFCLLLFLTATT